MTTGHLPAISRASAIVERESRFGAFNSAGFGEEPV
jgi:hypothetical protein